MTGGYADTNRWAGAAPTARPVAHDDRTAMSKRNRSRDQGITRASRPLVPANGGARARAPDFRRRCATHRPGSADHQTFATITAARQWRQDAASAIRAGTLTADRGPTLREAADDWLAAARAGIVRNRSGDPYKPSAIRGYEQNLRKRVLPELGHERLREITLPQLQRLVDRLAGDGLAAATITTTITPLRAIYRRARQLGEVQTNPVSGISVPSVESPPGTLRHRRAGRGDARAARQREGPRRCGRPPSTPACAAAS